MRLLIRISLLSIYLFYGFLFGEDFDVNYWHVGTYDEVIMLQKIAEKFREKTGLRVHIQPIPWGNFETKYLTALASGDPPDAGSSSINAAVDYGKVAGLIDLQREYPRVISKLKSRIFPNMWPTCYFRDHLFAIPYNGTALVGFYRKDIFHQLGLKAPKTWSELTNVLNTLEAHDFIYGFFWSRNTSWGLGTFIWPYDQLVYMDDGTRVNWNAPLFQKGYRYAIGLWNNYTLTTEKLVELFSLEGDKQALPLFFNYEFNYSEILIRSPQIKDKMGFFAFPKPDDGKAVTIMGGRCIVVFRKGKHPDNAMRWIEFLMSKESQLFQVKYMSHLGERSQLILPVNLEAWKEDFGLETGHQKIFYDIYSRLITVTNYPWTKESDHILERSIYKSYDVLQEYFQKTASRYNMSVRELKKNFAAGKKPLEKEVYQQFLVKETSHILKEAGKEAQQKLNNDRADYEKYYGQKLEKIIVSDTGWDILSYAKLVCILLIVLFFALASMNPAVRKNWISYVYIAPPVVATLVFIVIPIIVSLYLSFTRYNPVMPLSEAQWIGLDNYISILGSEELWQSLGRSLYFAVLSLPIQIAVAVVLAACLDKNLFPDRFYKFVYFSPLVTSIVSVSLIWFALYSGTEYGWINSLLLKLGLVRDPIIFLKDKATFLNAVIIMSIWQGLAFNILISLAGLQNVSKSLYEAASIDGANSFKQFFHISLPALRPQITFLVIMGTIGAIQVFEQIYMLGGGAGEAESKFGPDDCGMGIVPFLYRKGFEYFKMGEASAIAYILFILLFVVTFINLKYILKKES